MAVSEKVINEVFASAWEIAVHHNPMLLAAHHSQHLIVRSRQRIRELLAQGCSANQAQDRLVNELLDPNSPLYQSSN